MSCRLGLVLAIVAALVPAPAGADTTQRSVWCNSGAYAYATVNAPCVWDARHRGERPAGAQGSRSFVVSTSLDFYYIRHVRAHCMLRPHEPGACPGGRR